MNLCRIAEKKTGTRTARKTNTHGNFGAEDRKRGLIRGVIPDIDDELPAAWLTQKSEDCRSLALDISRQNFPRFIGRKAVDL